MFDMVPFRRNNKIERRGDVFENFLDSFFNDDFFLPSAYNTGSFRVDLKEDENNYLLDADMPGMGKDNIDINLQNNYLTISAKREDQVEENKDNYVRRERSYGEFKRSFYFDNIDEDNIKASFKDGVLHLQLPKKDKVKDEKKKINIE
ncbi:MAG: Hsp20/alpha crystallin family protein [Bacillota bacterium]|nr:Hsp20/alpha crystallin family protein [Bacillota bacterium]